MARSIRIPASPSQRAANYRQRMRASGLRLTQIWVPDSRSPEFVEMCKRQARAVAASDSAGDEIMRFLAGDQIRPSPTSAQTGSIAYPSRGQVSASR
jgi:hypothetical protein